METNINKCIKKEKIFLCKKVKRSKNNKNFIFDICKIKKIKKEISENDLSFISTNETLINDNFLLINEILVPSFLNDFIQSNVQIQEKLKKYDENSFQFENKEEVEIYMITKSSLIKDELIHEKII